MSLSQISDSDFIMDPLKLKDEGNEYFKSGKFPEALERYTEALTISDSGIPTDVSGFRGVVHSNKAACYLKLNQPNKALIDAARGKTPGY